MGEKSGHHGAHKSKLLNLRVEMVADDLLSMIKAHLLLLLIVFFVILGRVKNKLAFSRKVGFSG